MSAIVTLSLPDDLYDQIKDIPSGQRSKIIQNALKRYFEETNGQEVKTE